MAGNAKVKMTQQIGNVKLRNSALRNKLRFRFVLPTNVIIKLKARQQINNPTNNTEATQSLKVREGESNDE